VVGRDAVEELESEAGRKGAYFYYLSKKKESGRLLPLSFVQDWAEVNPLT